MTRVCRVCKERVTCTPDGVWIHAHTSEPHCGTGDGSVAFPESELVTRLRGAARHDATSRDDIVAVEVATGKAFARELPTLIPDTNDLPQCGQVTEEVHAAVEYLTGWTFAGRLSPPVARSALKRWAIGAPRPQWSGGA